MLAPRPIILTSYSRPPTSSMPFGFGKFETLGTSTVALILIAGKSPSFPLCPFDGFMYGCRRAGNRFPFLRTPAALTI